VVLRLTIETKTRSLTLNSVDTALISVAGVGLLGFEEKAVSDLTNGV
jgi:hypothetical protein